VSKKPWGFGLRFASVVAEQTSTERFATQTPLAFEKARQNFYGKLRFPDDKQK